jgi:hypothetical protein
LSAVIRWEEPPPDSRGGAHIQRRYDHEAIARELRAHPNEWAVVDGFSNPTWTTLIGKGKLIAYRPAGSFEAISRYGVVYVRFVGER